MASDYRRKTDSLPTCLHCGAMLYGDHCSHCGQRSAEAISFPWLWQRARDRLRRLDFAFVRTTIDLVIDPGRMARRYIRGRRLPYVGPFAYAFVMSCLLAGLVIGLGFDLSAPGTPWGPTPTSPPSPPTFVVVAFAGPLVALLVAFLQQRLYASEPYSAAETWIFGLYVFGHLALHQLLLGLLGAFASTTGLVALGGVLLMVLTFALGSFYRRPVWQSLPAALVLASVYVAGVFVVGASLRVWFGL